MNNSCRVFLWISFIVEIIGKQRLCEIIDSFYFIYNSGRVIRFITSILIRLHIYCFYLKLNLLIARDKLTHSSMNLIINIAVGSFDDVLTILNYNLALWTFICTMLIIINTLIMIIRWTSLKLPQSPTSSLFHWYSCDCHLRWWSQFFNIFRIIIIISVVFTFLSI